MKPLSLPRIVFYSLASFGANLVYALANFGFPLFLSSYHVSNLVVGFLAQERSFVGAFVQPIVGSISDRFPANRLGRRRPFFLIGVPLTAISVVLLGAHPSLWIVIAIMTVLSFFLAVAYDPYLALLPDTVPQSQRGLVGGVMAAFGMLAAIAVLGLSFLLWEQHQGLIFWLVAVGLLITFAVTFFAVREPAGLPTTRRQKRRFAAGTYVRDLLGRREMMKYLAATFCFWLGNGGVAPFLTRFGVDVLGVEESFSFLLVLPAILGTALFAVPAGMLTKRYGKKEILAVGLFLFGLICLVGAQVVRGVPEAIFLMSIVGIANAVTTALAYPLLTDMIPQDRSGELTGIGSLVQSLAQPIGAMGAGAMADVMGSMRGAFAAGGAAMLISFAILLTVHPERAFEGTPQTSPAYEGVVPNED